MFSHLPSTTSTSSSSFTLPSTTTPEHALQSAPHDLFQEHPVHNAHLRAPSVDNQRHQESLWRKNLQIGGNSRTTTPKCCEPKELATGSRKRRLSWRTISILWCTERIWRRSAPSSDHRRCERNLGEIGPHSLPDSTVSETVYFQSHMHFDDSAESIADSDLKDGELQKMLTSPQDAKKASGETRCIVFIWAGKPDQEFCVQKRYSVQFWEDLFLKVTRITCSIRQDPTWRSKKFMSSPSISASVNYNGKGKSKDGRYRTHHTHLLSLDEYKFDYKKNCPWKKKFSEILRSDMCTKWEKLTELKNNEWTRSQRKN